MGGRGCYQTQVTHFRMQSELLPSAWPVDEPSKDQSGKSLGSKVVTGCWMTFVFERISLKTTPCQVETLLSTCVYRHKHFIIAGIGALWRLSCA